MQETMRLLTYKQAAIIMQVHKNTICRWVKSGVLQAVGTGHTRRIPEENLRQLGKAS